uniref:Outer membrane protein beta-barrel domain-containing protein n=1 Tax=candidate division WOR-3 bacterium TaxID=2052148 RepID=A0A7V0Z574_UNCW3
MKKGLFALLSIIALFFGFDLTGRIGMGLGFSPDVYQEAANELITLPVVDLAVTRIGLKPKMVIEPIFQFTLKNANDNTSIYLAISGLGNFLMKGHQKTNLYAKGGLGFMLFSPGEGADTEFGFNLPFGFGLEHFVSEHFSLNLAALSGITFISNPPSGGDTYIEVKFGNAKPFAFYMVWYY